MMTKRIFNLPILLMIILTFFLTISCDSGGGDSDGDSDGICTNGDTRGTMCGVGACAGTGTETCTDGSWGGDNCVSGTPTAEICNNVDDDCDGETDESLTQNTTCGVGVCVGNAGTETCSAGSWEDDTCNPFEGAMDEVLDGIDNDCDGETDNSYSLQIGMSRFIPLNYDEIISVSDWEIQILETIRGEEAWQLIEDANMFNDPAPHGYEYILVKIYVKNISPDSGYRTINTYDFTITGDMLIEHDWASVVEPEPDLDADLFSEGETEGWAAFKVGIEENNLILIFDDYENRRFLAIDEGASIAIPSELLLIEPTSIGLSEDDPVPYGEQAIAQDWEIQILETIRGEEAWQLIEDANMFNDPAESGMEYVLVKIHIRYINTIDETVNINTYDFNIFGSKNVLYDTPVIVKS